MRDRAAGNIPLAVEVAVRVRSVATNWSETAWRVAPREAGWRAILVNCGARPTSGKPIQGLEQEGRLCSSRARPVILMPPVVIAPLRI
jgi:hypothetical protein